MKLLRRAGWMMILSWFVASNPILGKAPKDSEDSHHKKKGRKTKSFFYQPR